MTKPRLMSGITFNVLVLGVTSLLPFWVLHVAILKPLFAFATLPIQVFIVRILDRVGKGVRTAPRDALIADSVEEKVRGKAYGFHRSMDTLGAVIGPLTAFLLFPILWYRGVFLASVFSWNGCRCVAGGVG